VIADKLTKLAIELIETGWIPDRITREGIRRLCQKRLRSVDAGNDQENQRRLQSFVDEAQRGPIAPIPEKANEQHYEVPADLYRYVLGARRKYSSCYWPAGVTSLDEAEAASLRESCKHAQLEDGMRVLELGCGWGALSLWIAEHYPTCRITAVSNSHSQRKYIEQRAADLGFSGRLNVITVDMNEFATTQTFDRVMSIEMFEHMRNYAELLRRISNWLGEDGKLFVHIFCHRQFAYEFNENGADDWMGRYFFSGGIMPSDDYFSHFARDMRVSEQWRWNGRHYQQTAEAWGANLDSHREQLLPIIEAAYGGQAKRWWRRWRLLFLAGAELFGYRDGEEWYVSHYLLEPTHASRSVSDSRWTNRPEYSSI
jgi:cyclopropane-fatty-acyl-phospholipid synthase